MRPIPSGPTAAMAACRRAAAGAARDGAAAAWADR